MFESHCLKCLHAVSWTDSFTFSWRKAGLSVFAHLVLLLCYEPDGGLNSIIPQCVREIPLPTLYLHKMLHCSCFPIMQLCLYYSLPTIPFLLHQRRVRDFVWIVELNVLLFRWECMAYFKKNWLCDSKNNCNWVKLTKTPLNINNI